MYTNFTQYILKKINPVHIKSREELQGLYDQLTKIGSNAAKQKDKLYLISKQTDSHFLEKNESPT